MKPGDVVVVIGAGVGTVMAVAADAITVKTEEGEIGVHPDDAGRLMRSPVDRGAAQGFVAEMCRGVDAPRDLPEMRSLRKLSRSPLATQVAYVRLFYRDPDAVKGFEETPILAVAETLFAELGAALGVKGATVKSNVRRGKIGGAPRKPKALPKPVTPKGFRLAHSFEMGEKARFGEWAKAPNDALELDVAAGPWHAYFGRPDTEPEQRFCWVHHDHVALLSEPIEEVIGEVGVDAATVGLLSLAAFDDPDFGSVAEVSRRREDDDAFGRHGYETGTGGDGTHTVYGRRTGRRVVMLVVFC